MCYPENEDAIYKQKYAYFTHRYITEACSAIGRSFLLGRGAIENEGRRPEEIFKFRVSEMPFPGLWGSFDRILMVKKQRFSVSKFTICLQFSSTKWTMQFVMDNVAA